jgi:thymidylate kinase
MANGGLLIAVVGGDGSGKTTAIDALYAKFEDEFEIKKVHMGKPPWTASTVLIRGILKIGRSLGLYPFIPEGVESTLDTPAPQFPGVPWLIREVCTANDRLRAYHAARRFATNGGLVICDRYPLPQIKVMDGPQVERVTCGMKPNWFIEALARREKQYYRQISPPDLLIALRVDPEISVRRKTDEDSDSVRARAEEVWNVDWRLTPAHVVDAGQSKSAVMVDLMKLIWSHL